MLCKKMKKFLYQLKIKQNFQARGIRQARENLVKLALITNTVFKKFLKSEKKTEKWKKKTEKTVQKFSIGLLARFWTETQTF